MKTRAHSRYIGILLYYTRFNVRAPTTRYHNITAQSVPRGFTDLNRYVGGVGYTCVCVCTYTECLCENKSRLNRAIRHDTVITHTHARAI